MRFFLKKKQLISFHALLGPVCCAKLIKKTCKLIQSYEDAIPFLGQNDQIAVNMIFFWKTIDIIFMSLLAPFIVQSYKTILTVDTEFWGRMRNSGVLNGPFVPNNSFFGKAINITSMHY